MAEDTLPSFFWANNSNINQQLRQRIALQMLSQRKAFPKNVGEGLTAIGDAIGDLDKWALPLCSRHHRDQHSMSESEFWASHGINPFALAISHRRPE